MDFLLPAGGAVLTDFGADRTLRRRFFCFSAVRAMSVSLEPGCKRSLGPPRKIRNQRRSQSSLNLASPAGLNRRMRYAGGPNVADRQAEEGKIKCRGGDGRMRGRTSEAAPTPLEHTKGVGESRGCESGSGV